MYFGDRLKSKIMTVSFMVRAALIASIYIVLVVMFAPISYGPVQIRIAEAMTLLPYLWLEAVPGLFIGCLISNFLGGFGLFDVILGSAATLIAAILTRRMPNVYLAAFPPVLVNMVIVGWYLSILTNVSFFYAALYIGLGEVIACAFLGIPVILLLRRRMGKGKPEKL